MKQLTKQINQQTSALQKKGFAVKDISSGMSHNEGMSVLIHNQCS